MEIPVYKEKLCLQMTSNVCIGKHAHTDSFCCVPIGCGQSQGTFYWFSRIFTLNGA